MTFYMNYHNQSALVQSYFGVSIDGDRIMQGEYECKNVITDPRPIGCGNLYRVAGAINPFFFEKPINELPSQSTTSISAASLSKHVFGNTKDIFF